MEIGSSRRVKFIFVLEFFSFVLLYYEKLLILMKFVFDSPFYFYYIIEFKFATKHCMYMVCQKFGVFLIYT